MSRTGAVRQYGKPAKRSKAERLFAELPQSPVRSPVRRTLKKGLVDGKDGVGEISELVAAVRIDEDEDELGAGDGSAERASVRKPRTRCTRKSDIWPEAEGSPLERRILEEDDELSLVEGRDDVREEGSQRTSRTRGAKKAGVKRGVEDLPPPRTRRTRNTETKQEVEDTPRQHEILAGRRAGGGGRAWQGHGWSEREEITGEPYEGDGNQAGSRGPAASARKLGR